jgi:hypothetical protein
MSLSSPCALQKQTSLVIGRSLKHHKNLDQFPCRRDCTILKTPEIHQFGGIQYLVKLTDWTFCELGRILKTQQAEGFARVSDKLGGG